MPKIGIIGANGQVGAELCLLLADMSDIELIPVCRNRSGSAFLRYSGIACRHGRAADAEEAAQLIGDCDFIVNCALGTGTPGEIRAFDRKLIHNLFSASRPDAVVIHCSTLMVHGDPRPGRWLRLRNPYGRAKLAAEERVRAESRRFGKPGYTLRLGHVCGPHQNITHKIRSEISAGVVTLPSVDVASNTVYTLTIIDSIQSVLAGKERPGVYELTNSPQWTWREIYEFESQGLGVPFHPRVVAASSAVGWWRRLSSAVRARIGGLARTEVIRQTLEKCLALAPKALNDRAQAIWFTTRARADIAALLDERTVSPELSWIALDRTHLTSLQPTRNLLAGGAYEKMTGASRPPWPKDLALADQMPNQALVESTT